jgi:hypothetical protein
VGQFENAFLRQALVFVSSWTSAFLNEYAHCIHCLTNHLS